MSILRSLLILGGSLAVIQSFYRSPTSSPVGQYQKNNAPQVHINSPAANAGHRWNTQVPYTITVSDKEDGESKFGEITAAEVFLETHYFNDASQAKSFMQDAAPSAPGFALIRSQDCFNCHAVRSKVIGPSFHDIAEKYKKTSDPDLLAVHVLKGSAGIWGETAMPSHPDLPKDQATRIVKWILENGNDPDVDYLRGTEGSFWLRPPANASGKGVFVLKAIYTDHGLDNDPASALTGVDAIMLSSAHQ